MQGQPTESSQHPAQAVENYVQPNVDIEHAHPHHHCSHQIDTYPLLPWLIHVRVQVEQGVKYNLELVSVLVRLHWQDQV